MGHGVPRLEDIQAFFNNPTVLGVIFYFITLFGAAFVYVFKLHHDFEGSVAFFKKAFPGKSEAFYIRLDFIVVAIVGSIVGEIVFKPGNSIQALSAGFGWVSSLNVVLGGSSAPRIGGPDHD